MIPDFRALREPQGHADAPAGVRADAATSRRDLRWRTQVLFAVVAVFVLVLVYRLYDIQIVQHERYRRLALAEHWREEKVPAQRGGLYDANGQPLAITVRYATLYASTRQIEDPARLARDLAHILGEPADAIEAKLRSDSLAPTRIKAGLSADDAARVRRLRVDQLILRDEPRRSHPQGDLASQLVGVVGADGVGLSGAEMGLDKLLAGTPGVMLAERDTGGETIALAPREFTPPIDGPNVYLTVDRYVQRLIERELDAALARHRASAGTILVMDPTDGAILAVASRPTYRLTDPDLFSPESVAHYKLPAVSDAYEPGSTFKSITIAAAIDASVVTPQTSYFNNQIFRFAGGIVTNAVKRQPQNETVQQVLQRSSNIGTAWIATTMGQETFYRYIAAFGFGQATGVELPGEAAGLLTLPSQRGWHQFNLATNSFGQGMAVTPLQLARGFAAVVNGGRLVRPHVVREVARGGLRERYQAPPAPQVISPETARTMRELLVSVVEYDEGGPRQSKLVGYRLGAKTGTAEIPGPGGYGKWTIASCIGVGPADDPRFLILVKIDEPKDNPWGEFTAAPVFRIIAGQLMTYYAIPPAVAQAARP